MFQITDVKISLNSDERGKLKAIATMTLDNVFVVKDIKVIDGKRGLFVAMPCAQVTEKCPRCRIKNPINSRYCTNCGKAFPDNKKISFNSRREDYRDIAHPICKDCRDYIESVIVDAYKEKNSSPHLTQSA